MKPPHSRPETSFLPAFASSSFAASRESPDVSARQACSRIGPNLPMCPQDKLAHASVHNSADSNLHNNTIVL